VYQYGTERGKWGRYPAITLGTCLLICSVSAQRWYETSCCPDCTYRTTEWRDTEDPAQIRRFPTLCSSCGTPYSRRLLQCCEAVSCAVYRAFRGRVELLFALWHVNYCRLFAKLSLQVSSDCIGQGSNRGDRWCSFIFHFLWPFCFKESIVPSPLCLANLIKWNIATLFSKKFALHYANKRRGIKLLQMRH